MKITQDKIYFIISEIGGSNPGLWVELEQGHFFNEYDMQGVSAENDEIFFELVTGKCKLEIYRVYVVFQKSGFICFFLSF